MYLSAVLRLCRNCLCTCSSTAKGRQRKIRCGCATAVSLQLKKPSDAYHINLPSEIWEDLDAAIDIAFTMLTTADGDSCQGPCLDALISIFDLENKPSPREEAVKLSRTYLAKPPIIVFGTSHPHQNESLCHGIHTRNGGLHPYINLHFSVKFRLFRLRKRDSFTLLSVFWHKTAYRDAY